MLGRVQRKNMTEVGWAGWWGWVMRLGDEASETLIKTCFTDGFKYVNHIDDSAKL